MKLKEFTKTFKNARTFDRDDKIDNDAAIKFFESIPMVSSGMVTKFHRSPDFFNLLNDISEFYKW